MILLFLLFFAVPGQAAGAEAAPPRRLTLEDAVNIALAANRGLADAADRLESARYVMEAAEAQFELKISPAARLGVLGDSSDSRGQYGVGVTLAKRTASGAIVSAAPAADHTDDLWRTGVDLNLRQPLLRGSGTEVNLAPVRDAEFFGRSARRAFYQRQVETVLETAAAAYEVVQQRELLRVNEESAARLRGYADAARAKEKIGLAGPIDVYRAGIQLKTAEDALATAREAFRDARDSLKLVLALSQEEEIEVEAPLRYDLVALVEEEVVRAALANRIELEQAADTVGETERQSRLAKHNVLPELNVVLSYSRFDEGEGLGTSTALDRQAWGVNLETSTTLGRTVERAAFRQSLVSVRAAQRAQLLQRDEIVRQGKREFRSLRRAEQRIAIQQEQIHQAEGQLELANVKFRHGLANNFDVIEAETALRRAQTDLLGAVTAYIVGTFRLRGAMGTLLAKPESLGW